MVWLLPDLLGALCLGKKAAPLRPVNVFLLENRKGKGVFVH